MKKATSIWIPEKEIELDDDIEPEDLKSIVFTKIDEHSKKGKTLSSMNQTDGINSMQNSTRKKEIPAGIFVGPGRDAPERCAFVAHRLRQVNFCINLCSYNVYKGIYLCADRYNRQNDTHCATFVKKHPCSLYHNRRRKIFIAELCEPYCVYTYEARKA